MIIYILCQRDEESGAVNNISVFNSKEKAEKIAKELNDRLKQEEYKEWLNDERRLEAVEKYETAIKVATRIWNYLGDVLWPDDLEEKFWVKYLISYPEAYRLNNFEERDDVFIIQELELDEN